MAFKSKALQFHLTLWVALLGALLVCVYVSFKFVHFHFQLVDQHTATLSEFTYRSLTRLEANPNKLLQDNTSVLGNRKLQFVKGVEQLQQTLPNITITPQNLEFNKINIVFDEFNGLMSIADFILVFPIQYQQQPYYAFFRFKQGLNNLQLESQLVQSFAPVIFTSAAIISILFFVQFIHTYRTDNNVRELADWAKDLSLSKEAKTPPIMVAKGLNPLANMMNNSFQAFSKVLEKEHSFARFTSHELRTQITILSTNMEILEAIMADLSPSERKVLFRMEQAVSDMKYQTEALLWISKETEKDLVFNNCSLLEVIKKSLLDNQHLQNSKAVNINLIGQDRIIQSHNTLLQIIINNLVRNALQNTHKGEVTITIHDDKIEMVNQDSSDDEDSQDNGGFGIGLMIVEKIVERLNIDYKVEPLPNGRWVTLTL